MLKLGTTFTAWGIDIIFIQFGTPVAPICIGSPLGASDPR